MSELFSRNELYWGEEVQSKLKNTSVAVFGLGGVGGFACEMLARAGIGTMTIIDFDTVSESNINRQLIALHSTIGMKKTELFEKRLKDINPDIKLNVITDFYLESFDFSNIDYVVDAIDTMKSKVNLLVKCYENKVPVISSMGAGNRINPLELYTCDISEIKNKKDTFVQNILYQLGKKGITSGIDVVISNEKARKPEKIVNTEHIITNSGEEVEFRKITPSSTPFVASCAGIVISSIIVRKIMENN